MTNSNPISRALRDGPWRPVIEDLDGSQPQGLLDFPPGTNITLKSDLSFWQLLRVQFSNLFFTAVTVGVYRFWGRTRLRKRIWHSLEVAGVRLIYHGTGAELFISNLILVLMLAAPLLALSFLLSLFAIGSTAWLASVGGSALLFYVLWFAGRFWRFRYWAERTTWSGIRLRLAGNALVYASLAVWHGLIVFVTLGVWFPNMQMRLARYVVNHISLGSFQPQWVENRAGLSSAWILIWGIGLLALVSWIGFIFVQSTMAASGQTASISGLLFFLPAFAATVALPFAYMGYQVAFVRSVITSFALRELYLFSGVTFAQVLWIGARLFALFAGTFVVLSILGLLFSGLLDSWFSNLARSLYGSLSAFGDEPSAFLPTIPVLKNLIFWGVLVYVSAMIANAFVPLLSITLWLHQHAASTTMEGVLDFSKLTQVEPGRFRPAGEGVALALDMGGL